MTMPQADSGLPRHLTQFRLREAIIDAIRESNGAGAMRALKAFEAYDEFLTAAPPSPAAGRLPRGNPYHDDRGDLQEAWERGYRTALAASGASSETAGDGSPAPGLDVERLARALGDALYPNWPKTTHAGYAPWRDDAAKVAAEYARLTPVAGSASEEAEQD